MNNEHTEISSQLIQESSDMFIGEGYNLQSPSNIPGFKETTNFRPKYAHQTQEKKKIPQMWTLNNSLLHHKWV